MKNLFPFIALLLALSARADIFVGPTTRAADGAPLTLVSGEQQKLFRLPIRGIGTFQAYGGNLTATIASNLILSAKSNGQYAAWSRAGVQPLLLLDDGWAETNRINGDLVWQTNNNKWPTNFIDFAHAQGWGVIGYIDDGNVTTRSGEMPGSGPYIERDVQRLVNLGFDGMKGDIDTAGPTLWYRAAATLDTNRLAKTFYRFGSWSPTLGAPPARMRTIVNALRGVTDGDLSSFANLIGWSDNAATNGLLNDPISDLDTVYFAGTGAQSNDIGLKAHLILIAMFSSPMLWGVGDPNGVILPSLSGFSYTTNEDMLACQAEAYPVTRVLTTNGTDVYVKASGGPNGPNYYMAIINRDRTTNVTVTLNFTNALLSYLPLSQGTYSVYDCVSNQWVAMYPGADFTYTLGASGGKNSESALFKLYPGPVPRVFTNTIYLGSTNYQYVISNGMVLPLFTRVPWANAVSNYCTVAGITDPQEIADIQQVYDELNTPYLGVIPYTNLDDFYVVPDATSNACSLSFKNLRRITWTGAPTFNATTGMGGDGTNVSGDLGYAPTNTGVYKQDSAHIYIYSASQTVAGQTPAAMWFMSSMNGGGTVRVGLYNDGGGNLLACGPDNNDCTSGDGVSGDFRGPLCATRTGSTTGAASVRGSYAALTTTASSGLPDANFTLFGRKFTGFTDDQRSNIRVLWVSTGGAWSRAQLLNYNAIINRYQANRHRKVP